MFCLMFERKIVQTLCFKRIVKKLQINYIAVIIAYENYLFYS